MKQPARLLTALGIGLFSAAALIGAAHAWAEERLPELVLEYEAVVGRRDDPGYVLQAEVLERISDLRSEGAQQALRRLLGRYGSADRRRAAILLGAWLRYGTPRNLDSAIDWIEGRKDPLLIDLLHRIVARVRGHRTQEHLREGALRGATPRVKAQIVRALADMNDPEAALALLRLLRDDNLLVRVETLEALGRLKAGRALPMIQVFLRDANVSLRDAAARALGLLGDARALPALKRALGDEATLVVESVAGALGRIGHPDAIPLLIEGLAKNQNKNLRLVDAFADALQRLSGKAIAADADLWRSWWATMKDKPFRKAAEKPGRRTVGGPSYYGFPVRSSRVIFVLDVSRSMGWNERLETAQKEIIKVLEHLPRTTRFNLIIYSDRAFAWKSKLTDAKPAHLKNAIAFIRSQRPLSGTNSHGALARAFRDEEADTIFFLSDGHPSVGRITDPDLILMRVREWNRFRRVRIHAVALMRGEAPAGYRSLEDPVRSLSFMERLAEENNGRFKRVE